MSDVQVMQEDREAAADWLEQEGLSNIGQATNIRLGHLDDNTLVQAFARHRLATRPAPVGEPVAWMYERPWEDYTPSREVRIEPWATDVGRYTGWTETPLYTRPALDVAELVRSAPYPECDDYWEVRRDERERIIAAIKDATDAQ